MKTNEELNALKEEFEVLNKKLSCLTEEELAQVAGGDGVFDAGKTAKYKVGQHVKKVWDRRFNYAAYGTIVSVGDFFAGSRIYTVHYVCTGRKWGSYYRYEAWDHTNDLDLLETEDVEVIPELPNF